MKLKEQVLTIEQARHLQELGLDMSDAALGWYPTQIGITDDGFPMYSEKEFTIYERNIDSDYNIPTYTLQEIENILPNCIEGYYLHITKECIEYELPNIDTRNDILVCFSCNHPERRKALLEYYKMLCWVLENGYLKEDKNE